MWLKIIDIVVSNMSIACILILNITFLSESSKLSLFSINVEGRDEHGLEIYLILGYDWASGNAISGVLLFSWFDSGWGGFCNMSIG